MFFDVPAIRKSGRLALPLFRRKVCRTRICRPKTEIWPRVFHSERIGLPKWQTTTFRNVQMAGVPPPFMGQKWRLAP